VKKQQVGSFIMFCQLSILSHKPLSHFSQVSQLLVAIFTVRASNIVHLILTSCRELSYSELVVSHVNKSRSYSELMISHVNKSCYNVQENSVCPTVMSDHQSLARELVLVLRL